MLVGSMAVVLIQRMIRGMVVRLRLEDDPDQVLRLRTWQQERLAVTCLKAQNSAYGTDVVAWYQDVFPSATYEVQEVMQWSADAVREKLGKQYGCKYMVVTDINADPLAFCKAFRGNVRSANQRRCAFSQHRPRLKLLTEILTEFCAHSCRAPVRVRRLIREGRLRQFLKVACPGQMALYAPYPKWNRLPAFVDVEEIRTAIKDKAATPAARKMLSRLAVSLCSLSHFRTLPRTRIMNFCSCLLARP